MKQVALRLQQTLMHGTQIMDYSDNRGIQKDYRYRPIEVTRYHKRLESLLEIFQPLFVSNSNFFLRQKGRIKIELFRTTYYYNAITHLLHRVVRTIIHRVKRRTTQNQKNDQFQKVQLH